MDGEMITLSSLSVFIRSLMIWEKVHDFQHGIKSYQQKVNLTAPTISFPKVEKHEMFSIIYEPVHGIIFKNSKKEKRVMRHSEIYKFCDATLNIILEGLKSSNNDVSYGYNQIDLTKDEVEYLKLFEEEIEDRLKYRRQMRRKVAPTPSFAIIQRLISDNFHIKSTHMQMIWDNQFDGRICNETLVEAWIHLKEMLRICYEHGLTKGTIVYIFYHGLYGLTQGILDAGGIILYNTPNEAFKILKDKFLLKHEILEDSKNTKAKTLIPAGGNNINSNYAILMEKFKALTSKIYSEFLIIKKELKEMRDDCRDNHASQIYMKDDMPMCKPYEANYVQRYHEGYHDHKLINSYSYPNHNPNHHYPYPRNQMPYPS
nr:reverse transcriptase domain-containing protein [Tanacetum cinerariifolium]